MFVAMTASTLVLVLVSDSFVCAYIETRFVHFPRGQQFRSFNFRKLLFTREKRENKFLAKISNHIWYSTCQSYFLSKKFITLHQSYHSLLEGYTNVEGEGGKGCNTITVYCYTVYA